MVQIFDTIRLPWSRVDNYTFEANCPKRFIILFFSPCHYVYFHGIDLWVNVSVVIHMTVFIQLKVNIQESTITWSV